MERMFIFRLLLVVVVVVVDVAAIVPAGSPRSRSRPKTKAASLPGLFLFGDSLLDVGTNAYLNLNISSNFPPYGRDYFHHPTGRFSNGRNMADFIAQNLGIPFPLPYVDPDHNVSNGVNFASGGSGILNETGQRSKVFSLSAQLEQFGSLRRRHNSHDFRTHISESLFVISSGGNDLMNYAPFMMVPPDVITGWLVDGIATAIRELYEGGARKIVVLGLGPLGCLPPMVAIAGSCVDFNNELALGFNNWTLAAIANLTSSLPGLNVVLPKVYDLVTDLTTEVSNPYGFDELELPCCGGAGRFRALAQCGRNGTTACSDASSFFFWDSVHPTEAAAELVVRMAWTGGPEFATPFNISTLVAL